MKKVIKLWDKVIVMLLGIAGVFSGCKRDCIVPMYGAYASEYVVGGMVADKTNNTPINNIRIIREGNDFFDLGDTLYTDSQGKFKFLFNSFDFDVHLKVEDIDDEENGGYFESKEIDIKITTADRVKKCGECENVPEKYVKTQNIELETKK